MLGFFHITGIDTALDPPQSSVDPSLIRQDPSLTNLYDDGYTALELWIEANRGQTQLLLEANLGDWFNLLNQGRIKAGIANSDITLGKPVRVSGQMLAAPIEGIAQGVDEWGRLLVREENGRLHTVSAGDVSLRG
jgi:biotin-(acetyl-CoA carboxylase) ligase